MNCSIRSLKRNIVTLLFAKKRFAKRRSVGNFSFYHICLFKSHYGISFIFTTVLFLYNHRRANFNYISPALQNILRKLQYFFYFSNTFFELALLFAGLV